MLKKWIVLLLILSIIISCKGPAGSDGQNGINGDYDKVVRITFNNSSAGFAVYGTWYDYQEIGLISKFKLGEYIGVDKAFLLIQYYIQYDPVGSDSIGVRLYDYLNKQTIDGSEIWSNMRQTQYKNNPDMRTKKSDDIYDSLDQLGEANIGLQFKKQDGITDDRFLIISRAEIVLYRSSDIESVNQFVSVVENFY